MKSGLCLQLITPHKVTTALTSDSFFPLLLQCRTPYAVIHSLVLLKMGMMMPETCWERSLIINTRLVASCWFLFLHTTSVICPLMEGLKTGVDAWSKFTIVTLLYNFSFFLCLMQPTHILVGLHFFSVGGIPLGK